MPPIDPKLIWKARNQALRRLARAHFIEFNTIYSEERERLGLPPLRDEVVSPQKDRRSA